MRLRALAHGARPIAGGEIGFERNQITAGDGKGEKERTPMPPEQLKFLLTEQFLAVKIIKETTSRDDASGDGIFDLLSDSTFVNMFDTLTGFTYRGLPARGGQVTP